METGIFAIGVDPSRIKRTHHEFTVAIDFHDPITYEQAKNWLHYALAKIAEKKVSIADD